MSKREKEIEEFFWKKFLERGNEVRRLIDFVMDTVHGCWLVEKVKTEVKILE